MPVLDMIEPRKQMLQKEVISIKQPSQHTMMILLVSSYLKLQLVIHTWVLIHPVMNLTILTQINLAHLSLPDKNFNPDYSEQTQIQNQNISKETSQTEMDWPYILARTYIQTFEPRGKRGFTKV